MRQQKFEIIVRTHCFFKEIFSVFIKLRRILRQTDYINSSSADIDSFGFIIEYLNTSALISLYILEFLKSIASFRDYQDNNTLGNFIKLFTQRYYTL